MIPDVQVDLLSRILVALGAVVIGGVAGAAISLLKPLSEPILTLAAAFVGLFVGLATSTAVAVYRFSKVSPGIGAVSFGVGVHSIAIPLLVAVAVGLLAHIAFGKVGQAAPIVACAIAAGLTAYWSQ